MRLLVKAASVLAGCAAALVFGSTVAPANAAQAVSEPAAVSVEPAAIGTIQLGDKGTDVRKWQRGMRAWQLFWQTCRPTLEVDGDFGTLTHNATKCFQRVVGLRDDGIVGPNTRAAMCTELRIIGRGDLADQIC